VESPVTDSLREVRAVLAAELSGELAGVALIKRCTEVARLLQSNDVPHEVWHYLSDADIRVRDREYANVQLERIKALLSKVP
jgi:hypothetical protein